MNMLGNCLPVFAAPVTFTQLTVATVEHVAGLAEKAATEEQK